MTFVIISIIVFNGIAFFMPKRISRAEIYATALFALFLEYLANYIFDFVLGVYGYFKPGIDIVTFIVVVGIYPAINTIFLNYFPYKRKGLAKFIYIIGTSLFSLFYEWLSLQSKYFYHNSWNFWLSAISYPILFGIIALNFKFVRNLERRDGEQAVWVFLGVSFSLIAGVVIFMRRKMSKLEFYISYLFMLVWSWSLNVVIDAKFSLRGYFEKGPDFSTMLIYIILFPCLGVIFLNFYPHAKKSIAKKALYFIFSVLLVLAYDVLLIKFNILHYYHWNYLYSIMLYAVDFAFILLNKKIISYL